MCIVHHVCALLMEARRGHWIPQTGHTSGCEPPSTCWESNQTLWERQPVLGKTPLSYFSSPVLVTLLVVPKYQTRSNLGRKGSLEADDSRGYSASVSLCGSEVAGPIHPQSGAASDEQEAHGSASLCSLGTQPMAQGCLHSVWISLPQTIPTDTRD